MDEPNEADGEQAPAGAFDEGEPLTTEPQEGTTEPQEGEPLPAPELEPIQEETAGNIDEPQGDGEPVLEGNEELPPDESQPDDVPQSRPQEPPYRELDRVSTVSSLPVVDPLVLDELKKADEEAVKVAKSIEDLRASIATYKEKEEISEEDARELKEKQDALLEKLTEFDEITKKVQKLIGLIDLDVSALSLPILDKSYNVRPQKLGIETERKGTDAPGRELEEQTEHISAEDKLPKIVVGAIQGSIPRIIVCDNLKKKPRRQPNICKRNCPNMMMSLLGTFTDERCCGKDKPMPENLQTDGFTHDDPLLCRENPLITLQREVEYMEAEIDLLLSQNSCMTEMLGQQPCTAPCAQPQKKKSSPTITPNWKQQELENEQSDCYESVSKLKCELNNLHKGIRGLKYEMGRIQQERVMAEPVRQCNKDTLPSTGCFPTVNYCGPR